jgi:hypothetical protein
LLDGIGERLGFDIDRIKAEIDGDQHETDATDEATLSPVRHPTDQDIVDQALSTMIAEKQKAKASEMPAVENHEAVEVELDIGEPMVVLHMFAKRLYDINEDLLGYLYQNSLFDVSGPSLEASDAELITYVIEQRDEDARPAAFVGGASPLRINLANNAGLTADESKLVKLAHEISASENGYDRHLLLDEVVVIPLEEPDDNPFAGGT